MTEPASPAEQQQRHQPSPIPISHDNETVITDQDQQQQQQTPSFAPIYTLVTNTSTRTMHHPHVHYIFSDDDPDLLTQALAAQHDANIHESSSDPSLNNRAVILDLERNGDGAYSVSWASSLSPSWAVLDAQVSQISPPSSDEGGGSGDSGAGEGGSNKKPGRLMLRIEGVEGDGLTSEVELRISGERSGSRQGSGSGSRSGSGQRDRGDRGDGSEDYGSLVEEFDKRMTMLRKVVVAGEERRRKIAVDTSPEGQSLLQRAEQPTVAPGNS